MRTIELAGQTFGRWHVIERAPNTAAGQAQWRCRCACGSERIMPSILLRNGISRSCGCLKREQNVIRSTKHGHSPSTGLSPTYNTWSGMIARCTNPKHRDYPRYGGRGIAVCERWLTFANFLADMGVKPVGLTLDRIDNDKGYDAENCRWATAVSQARNKSSNRILSLHGVSKTVVEWAQQLGMNQKTLSHRVNHGWTAEEALTIPVKQSSN